MFKNIVLKIVIPWVCTVAFFGAQYFGEFVLKGEDGFLGFLRMVLILFGLFGFFTFFMLAMINTCKALFPEDEGP